MNKTSRSETIKQACADAGITLEDARSPSREPYLSIRRWRVMASLRAREWSLPQIGEALDRDHTTVLAGLRRLAKLKAAVND